MIAERGNFRFSSFLTGNSAADGRAAGSYDAPAPPLLWQAGCLETSSPAVAAAGVHCPFRPTPSPQTSKALSVCFGKHTMHAYGKRHTQIYICVHISQYVCVYVCVNMHCVCSVYRDYIPPTGPPSLWSASQAVSRRFESWFSGTWIMS